MPVATYFATVSLTPASSQATPSKMPNDVSRATEEMHRTESSGINLQTRPDRYEWFAAPIPSRQGGLCVDKLLNRDDRVGSARSIS